MADTSFGASSSVSSLSDKEPSKLSLPSPGRRRTLGIIKRVALWAAGVSTAGVVVIGALHTKLGAPILAKLGGKELVCPVKPRTPAQMDGVWAFASAPYVGKPKAVARPVLNFSFEKTTLTDVEDWVRKFDVSCEKVVGTETVRACKNVPAVALGQPEWFGPAASVSFGFRSNRALTSVTVLRYKLTVEQANAITAEVDKRLQAALGDPSTKSGENNLEYFSQGPFQSFSKDWAFGDYGATLGEMRLASGVSVREQYFAPVL